MMPQRWRFRVKWLGFLCTESVLYFPSSSTVIFFCFGGGCLAVFPGRNVYWCGFLGFGLLATMVGALH